MRIKSLVVPLIIIWTTLIAATASASDSELAEELKAARLALDTAFENQDEATIMSMVTPDHFGVTSYFQGSFVTAEEIAALRELKVRYFDFSETKVYSLGPDAAMITFENNQSGTYDGKPLPSRIFVSEVWVRQSGKWLQKSYQETPIAD